MFPYSATYRNMALFRSDRRSSRKWTFKTFCEGSMSIPEIAHTVTSKAWYLPLSLLPKILCSSPLSFSSGKCCLIFLPLCTSHCFLYNILPREIEYVYDYCNLFLYIFKGICHNSMVYQIIIDPPKVSVVHTDRHLL